MIDIDMDSDYPYKQITNKPPITITTQIPSDRIYRLVYRVENWEKAEKAVLGYVVLAHIMCGDAKIITIYAIKE